VGQAGIERRRFGDDCRVGPDPGKKVRGAATAILFVGHRGDDHVLNVSTSEASERDRPEMLL